MGKLYVFMGKSASGKDTIYQKVMERNPSLMPVISYTTRPIRANEKNGLEYFFVTKDKMQSMESNGEIIECRCYQTVHGPWYYFTANDGQIDFEKGDYCIITTLEGYEQIVQFFGQQRVVPLYINVDEITRIRRSIDREAKQSNPSVAEVCRRFLADEKDFSKENLKRLGIDSAIENNDLDTAIKEIESIIINSR